MKLLVINHDYELLKVLRRGLRASYIIDPASTRSDAVHLATAHGYDAIIVNAKLEDDCIATCDELRSSKVRSPIMVIQGSENVSDKVNTLDAGADDYICVPLVMEELKARLRALVRRDAGSGHTSKIQVGGLEMDMATRKVTRGGVAISLRRKEFGLLEYLMHNSGKVVTRSMIIDHVWDMNENLWTNAVDVHIKYLRDKIDRPFETPLIHTIHGVGYKLEATEAKVHAQAL